MDAEFSRLITSIMGMVPMVGTLGIEFVEFEPQRAVFTMPDSPEFHGPADVISAGALFTLGETAAGALLFGNFAQHLDRVTPLMAGGTLTNHATVRGTTTATATMRSTPGEILGQVDLGVRPEWQVEVAIRDSSDVLAASLVAEMTLRIN